MNTEAAGVITGIRTRIHANLKCNHCIAAMEAGLPPIHEVVISWEGQGFVMSRPGCASEERPGVWNFESIDGVASSCPH